MYQKQRQTSCLADDRYTAPPPNDMRQLSSVFFVYFWHHWSNRTLVFQLKNLSQSLWKEDKWSKPHQTFRGCLQAQCNIVLGWSKSMPTIIVSHVHCNYLTSVEDYKLKDSSNLVFVAIDYSPISPTLNTPVRLTFVIGKTYVAPLRQHGVPKLELEAAILSVRSIQINRKAPKTYSTPSYF